MSDDPRYPKPGHYSERGNWLGLPASPRDITHGVCVGAMFERNSARWMSQQEYDEFTAGRIERIVRYSFLGGLFGRLMGH